MINEQDRAEEFGDGYRNEFQRAAAVSQIRGADDDRSLANKFVAEGYCVVVELSPWYCSITDAVLGTRVHVWFHDRSRQVCLDKGMPPYDPDTRVEVWPVLPTVPAAAEPVEDTGVPF
jgi:hypothetical protein